MRGRVVEVSLLALAVCMASAWSPIAAAADDATRAPASREAERARATRLELDREAARLEIRASQMSAWSGYARAVAAMSGEPPRDERASMRADDAGAAQLTRQRAQRAQAMAQRLAQIADATGKLEAALSPEQRQVLDQIVRLRPPFGREPHPFGPPGGAGAQSCGPDPRFAPGRPPADGIRQGGPGPSARDGRGTPDGARDDGEGRPGRDPQDGGPDMQPGPG